MSLGIQKRPTGANVEFKNLPPNVNEKINKEVTAYETVDNVRIPLIEEKDYECWAELIEHPLYIPLRMRVNVKDRSTESVFRDVGGDTWYCEFPKEGLSWSDLKDSMNSYVYRNWRIPSAAVDLYCQWNRDRAFNAVKAFS